MRKIWKSVFVAALLAIAGFSPAFAQGVCTTILQKPVTIAGTTYTLGATDGCSTLIFTNGSAVAVTAPNPALVTGLPQGWWVNIKAQGAGTVTVTPTTATVDGVTTVAVTTTKSIMLLTNGTNYWSLGGGINQ